MPLVYQLDISSAQQLHRKYQTILHPDRFATSATELLSNEELLDRSSAISAFASIGLETLACPVQRACSLLEIVSDHRALEETSRVDQELAMEVFAIREEIDDAETIDEVMPIQIEIN